jgi:hypothetical protein
MSHTELLIKPQGKPVACRPTAHSDEGTEGTDHREEQCEQRVGDPVAHRHGITPQQLYRWRWHDRHQEDGAHGKCVTLRR